MHASSHMNACAIIISARNYTPPTPVAVRLVNITQTTIAINSKFEYFTNMILAIKKISSSIIKRFSDVIMSMTVFVMLDTNAKTLIGPCTLYLRLYFELCVNL
jgi:hypothetical protein